MAKKKKGQRADGLIEIARKMPDGKTRHFYGHSRAECEDKYQRAELWACPCIAAQSFRAISIQQRIARNAVKTVSFCTMKRISK